MLLFYSLCCCCLCVSSFGGVSCFTSFPSDSCFLRQSYCFLRQYTVLPRFLCKVPRVVRGGGGGGGFVFGSSG